MLNPTLIFLYWLPLAIASIVIAKIPWLRSSTRRKLPYVHLWHAPDGLASALSISRAQIANCDLHLLELEREAETVRKMKEMIVSQREFMLRHGSNYDEETLLEQERALLTLKGVRLRKG